jgi:hypothetical protein
MNHFRKVHITALSIRIFRDAMPPSQAAHRGRA